MKRSVFFQKAVTLIETLVVIAIISLIALVVMPDLSSGDKQRLEWGAQQVAAALRFAREESVRTYTTHGVNGDLANQRISVYSLDTSGATPTFIYNIRHPINKSLYILNLGQLSSMRGVRLQRSEFTYQGLSGSVNSVSFLSTGQPYYNDSGTRRFLTQGQIDLQISDQIITVVVEPNTARVKIQ